MTSFEIWTSAFFQQKQIRSMSNGEAKNERHRIIFADRQSLTPNANDLEIKRQWIEIYNENRNEGALRSDGTIAWDCPCLGTQAIGPCSVLFRTAFSCYQNSNRERKGAFDHSRQIGGVDLSSRFWLCRWMDENARVFCKISDAVRQDKTHRMKENREANIANPQIVWIGLTHISFAVE